MVVVIIIIIIIVTSSLTLLTPEADCFFLKIYFICIYVYACLHMYLDAHGIQKRAVGPCSAEFWAVVRCLIWMLVTKPRVSERAAD